VQSLQSIRLRDIDLSTVIWQYKGQSDRSAMRIASSPTLRIATGLLLAVLLSVVGYQVVRRLNSHGPEALLERADGSSWPDIEVRTSPVYIYEELGFNLLPVAAHETPTSQPLHAAIGSSIPVASRDRIADLRLPPDLVWRQFPLSRRPIRSQQPNAAEDCRHSLSRRAGSLTR